MKASAANDSNTNEEGSETAGVEENKKKAAFADDKKPPRTETNVEIENITQGKGSKSEGEIWKTVVGTVWIKIQKYELCLKAQIHF